MVHLQADFWPGLKQSLAFPGRLKKADSSSCVLQGVFLTTAHIFLRQWFEDNAVFARMLRCDGAALFFASSIKANQSVTGRYHDCCLFLKPTPKF